MADRNLNIIINAVDNASAKLKGIDSALERNKATIQKTTLAATAAFAGIAVGINKAVQEAGNAEKIAVNFENTFGESTDTINSFIEDFGSKFAFIESEMMDGANSIGFQLNAMGEIGQEQGEEMTKSLLTASGALSDFFGETVNVTDAANAMAKGLAGNRQQLIDMGFNVLEEDIGKAAERMGFFSDNLTKAQEAQIFTNLIMEQTEGSVEGLNSTFDTFTGQQRALDKAVVETTQTLGAVFIPMAADLLAAVRPVIERVAAWIEQNPELTRNIVIAAAAITGLVAVLGMVTLALMAITPMSLLVTAGLALITAAVVLGIQYWDKIKETVSNVTSIIMTTVSNMKDSVVDAVTTFVNATVQKLTEFWEKWRNVFIFIGGVITGLYIPTLAKMLVATVIHMAKTIAQWALLATQTTIHATVVAVRAIPMIITSLGRMAVQAVLQTGIIIAKFALMAAGAVASATKIAFAWLLAFGPVGLIMGLVVGVAALVVANWDKIKAATEKLGITWSDVWEGIKRTTVRVVGAVVTLVEGMINTVISGINGVIRMINSVIRAASKVPGFKGASNLTISEISEVDFGGVEMLQSGKMGGDTVNVTVNGDVSGEDLIEKVGFGVMNRLGNNIKLSTQ